MRNATAAFKRAIADGRRDYQDRAVITLADGTVLTGTKTTIDEDTGEETVETVNYLTNENIWTDGLSLEDAVSNDNVFQIGAAIINQCKLILNNIYDEYTEYDFKGATVKLFVGLDDLDDGTSDEVRMGTFIVDSAEHDIGIVTLTCLDNMSKFDKPYTDHIPYPATLAEIVSDCCAKCSVSQNTSYITFPHSTLQIPLAPSGESTTYRQVLSWAAQIAGCYARCDSNGQLCVKFYDFSGLNQAQDNLDGGSFDDGTPTYTSGDDADGGSFNPWDTGYVYDAGGFVGGSQVHLISSDFSSKVSLDDVVVTEIRIAEKVNTSLLSSYAPAYSGTSTYAVGAYVYNENDLYQCITAISTPEEFNRDHWAQISVLTRTSGTEGYTISIEDNGLIMGNTAQSIADALIADLGGITFRPANITHPSDPTMEAGDVGLFWDRKGKRYPIIISSTNFTSGNSQNTVSSAETPARNSAQRFSQATANYVAMREQVERQTKYFNQVIDGASGLYCTQETQPGGTVITYYHDKKLKSDSELVMSFSTAGFSVTADYQTPQSQGGPTWYGITFDGQFFASVISTINLFFDYAKGGTLTLGGLNNVNGILRILDATNYPIATINNLEMHLNDIPLINTFSDTDIVEYQNVALIEGRVDLYYGDENAKTYVGVVRPTYWESDPDIKGMSIVTSSDYMDFSSYAGATDLNNSFFMINNGVNPDSYSQDIIFWKRPIFSDGLLIGTPSSNALLRRTAVNAVPALRVPALSVDGDVMIDGYLTVGGGKPRMVNTKNYGRRLLYAYETPTPYFGDIGTARTDEDGMAYVSIDDMFHETVTTEIEYSVFLQKEGPGDLWVEEKEHDYFVVKGTPDLKFSWEVKVVQRDFEQIRMEDTALIEAGGIEPDTLEDEFDAELKLYDIETQRMEMQLERELI